MAGAVARGGLNRGRPGGPVGVKLLPEGDRLRIFDAATGERLLWPDEAQALAERESKARQEAEERVRALEEELIRLRR